ncbi:MAG: choice-of-anchor Q domain-containing protein [Thermoanaerobaculia bacterium]
MFSRAFSPRIRLLFALSIFVATAASAATYYVRTDGGSAEQCTGLADAPYPGAGTAQACAWDHPFRALPPEGTIRIAGGDTLIISDGSYMIGIGAPETGNCEPEGAFACLMPPIPSGPDETHPTRIVGRRESSGCVRKPELWGTERVDTVLNLDGSSNVEIACLEVTDHSGCVESHSGPITCERDAPPFGPWAVRRIYAADSSNVTLKDLDIHGLAGTGVHAGRLKDWTVENVRIAANGWSGWDGDIDGDDSNSGTLRFTRWTVEWNGCGETWPGRQPVECWAQTAGGYGDGVGTGATQGHWIIEESAFLHNTSDGLDLLYARPGSSIEIRRTIAEGNAGNQIKTSGPAILENVIAVGNCGFFEGQPFTFNVDPCRAVGNTLSLDLWKGDRVSVVNSTVTSEGDCVVLAGCSELSQCNGSEGVVLRNDILIGEQEFLDPTDRSCVMYQETFPHDPFDVAFVLVYGVKDDACPGSHAICGAPPGLVGPGASSFDARLLASSPAINAGTTEGAPRIDFAGAPRDALPDIGAYEWRPAPPRRRSVTHP